MRVCVCVCHSGATTSSPLVQRSTSCGLSLAQVRLVSGLVVSGFCFAVLTPRLSPRPPFCDPKSNFYVSDRKTGERNHHGTKERL